MYTDYSSYESGRRRGQEEAGQERNNAGFGGFFLAFFIVGLFCFLYPFTAALTLGTFFASAVLLRPLADAHDGFNQALIGGLAPFALGFGALVLGAWLEGKLTPFPVYYWIRHVTRTALVVAVAFHFHFHAQYGHFPAAVGDVLYSLSRGVSVVVVLAAGAVTHFLLRALRKDERKMLGSLFYAVLMIIFLSIFLFCLIGGKGF